MERRRVLEIAHLDLRLRLERREIGEVGDTPEAHDRDAAASGDGAGLQGLE